MIFWAIPWNLLLWGFESWAFRQSPLEKLDVFLHRNIRRIWGTRIGQVRECHIKNSHIRKMFYNIPCVRNQVAFKQLTYVGKIMRCERSHVPTIILTSWCDNPRKRGGQFLTNKESLVQILEEGNLPLPRCPRCDLRVPRWRPLSARLGTRRSHLGHRGRGRLPSSKI